jgi:hypothetical protein
MQQEPNQSTKNSTELYKFRQLFTTNSDLDFIKEQVMYLINKKYKNNDINCFVSFLMNIIFNSKQNTVLLVFNKQSFNLSKDKLMIFLDPSMKIDIFDILDTIKLVLCNCYLVNYNIVNLTYSSKSIDFQIFVTFDEN